MSDPSFLERVRLAGEMLVAKDGEATSEEIAAYLGVPERAVTNALLVLAQSGEPDESERTP